MLRDLTRDDWLSTLGLPEERIPRALILRGTRDLKFYYRAYQAHFENILELGDPNKVVDDLFIGDLGGVPVAYASVYGAPMASELTHIFGVLGTPLVIQTGCYGALAGTIELGDLLFATRAYCGEGAAQYYRPERKVVEASLHLTDLPAFRRVDDIPLHFGRIYTTSALFAEGEREVEAWFRQGYAAIDMETATTFAVAEHFGMDRLSILFAFDNPRRQEHILLTDAGKERRRARGNERMIALALEVVKEYQALRDGLKSQVSGDRHLKTFKPGIA
ncbi:MAG: hypothetical protein ACE5H9_01375 [Anaerolineae bacterium]